MIGVVSLQQSVEMLSHADILHWASTVPAYVATAVVLSAGAAAALTCGLLRSRAATRLWLPGVAFVTLSTAAIWPLRTAAGAWRLRGVLMGAAGVALLVDALACEKQRDESTGKSGAATGVSRLYLAIASLGAGMFLFSNLSGYSGDALLPWEASVTLGFGEAFTKGLSVVHFTLQRFLWDDGILSAGNTSLFYGAPTYALFHTAGFSPWTLRCAAVAATLLSIAVAYAVGRHFFGPVGPWPWCSRLTLVYCFTAATAARLPAQCWQCFWPCWQHGFSWSGNNPPGGARWSVPRCCTWLLSSILPAGSSC